MHQVTDLIDTTEMYLKTIFEMEEEGIVPMRARIAERLGHTGPTVSQTVARMERDGLLHVSGDRHLELSALGRQQATRVMRKHRLAERLLLDVIGLEWQYVHEEACRWEHVMSDRVERKLLGMLTGPMESPYGNPIPGLEELGGPAADAADFRVGVVSMLDALDGDEPSEVVVRRLGEPLQTNVNVMSAFAEHELGPGSTIRVSRTGQGVRVQLAGTVLELPLDVAGHVFVAAPEGARPLGTAASGTAGNR